MLTIKTPTQTYYKSCNATHFWDGSLKNAPDWLINLVEEGKASVLQPSKSLAFNVRNGYPFAPVNSLIILSNEEDIEVFKGVSHHEQETDDRKAETD